MKKLIALVLITAFAFLILAACAETAITPGENNREEHEQIPGDQQPDEALAEPRITHSLPDDLDFGGHTFRILNTIQEDRHYVNLMMESIDEELTGEIINDAAFRRSAEIQERFNCTIIEIRVTAGTRNSRFRQSALAGDDAYDISMLQFGEALSAAQEGMIYDINELIYINLDAPWWDQNARSSLSLMNKVFFCPGAYELANFDMTRIILFNKKLMQDYGIEYCVYELVETGRWTFDRFFDMARQVSADLDGDGAFDYRDKFGVASTADHVVFGSFMMGSGERTVRKDANDLPYFAAGTERFNRVFISMVDNFYDGDFYFAPRNVPQAEEWCTNMFNEDRLLFYNITFNRIPIFRSMDADFGILPIPKFDESQENYYCESGNGVLAVIPVSASDPNRSGAFLELYAYFGWRYVVPAYKEISLQTMFARDDESAAMVDLIDVSRVYDLGRLYWSAAAWYPFVDEFGAARTGVATVTERNAARATAAIERTLEFLFE